MLRAVPPVVLATLSLACGNGTDERASQRSDASPPTVAAKANTATNAAAKVGASCLLSDAVPTSERNAIVAAAQTAFDKLKAGNLDGLMGMMHPQAGVETQRDAFGRALQSMQRRLSTTDGPPEVRSTAFVDIRGGASALARVHCGSPETDDGFTLLTNAGSEDVAVVSMHTGGDPFGYLTTIQLRRHDKTWRLLGVHVGLDTYRDLPSAAYEQLADAYVEQSRIVEAYLVLLVAQQLADRGASLKPDRALALANKLDAVTNSKQFQQQLGVWQVGGRDYDIQGFSVTATQSDLSAVVRYVTPTGLIQEALDLEADALVRHLDMQHPEIAKRFDAAVFEAYDSESSAARKDQEVQAFRTARVFAKNRDTESQ